MVRELGGWGVGSGSLEGGCTWWGLVRKWELVFFWKEVSAEDGEEEMCVYLFSGLWLHGTGYVRALLRVLRRCRKDGGRCPVCSPNPRLFR